MLRIIYLPREKQSFSLGQPLLLKAKLLTISCPSINYLTYKEPTAPYTLVACNIAAAQQYLDLQS